MSKKTYSILAFVPPNKDGTLVLKETLFFQQTLGMRLFVINVIKTPSLLSSKFQAQKVKTIIRKAKDDLIDFIQDAGVYRKLYAQSNTNYFIVKSNL